MTMSPKREHHSANNNLIEGSVLPNEECGNPNSGITYGVLFRFNSSSLSTGLLPGCPDARFSKPSISRPTNTWCQLAELSTEFFSCPSCNQHHHGQKIIQPRLCYKVLLMHLLRCESDPLGVFCGLPLWETLSLLVDHGNANCSSKLRAASCHERVSHYSVNDGIHIRKAQPSKYGIGRII